MILEISQYGNPVLRKKCKKVEVVNDELKQLVSNMLETMVDAHGVGLAAPQVGIDIQLAVIDVSHDPECISYLRVDGKETALDEIMPLIFINPVLIFGREKERLEEGCLSIQDIRAHVNRPIDVKAQLELLDGRVLEIETDGLLARAIQHETDHLNGILFVDRLSPAAKVSMKRRLLKIAGER